jgi:hypothetical protein
MLSLGIRFGVLIGFFILVTAWYFIPDTVFVKYSDAADEYIVQDTKKSEEKVNIVIEDDKQTKQKIKNQDLNVKSEEEDRQEQDNIQKNIIVNVNKVKQSVPFIVQAPHAQWDELKYQDACEEASLVMADAWLQGDRHIAKNEAEDKMEELFEKEIEIFGEAIDTSVADTVKVFEQHYNHEAEIINNVTMSQMYDILNEGNIIIVPTNGKWLNNPHFTNGGPERHMLVVTGFDRKNKEFITNDPGTRLGRGYKYKDSTLFNAIRDYKTGNKKDIQEIHKNIIVIKK